MHIHNIVTIMSKFNGTWKLIKVENFAEYLDCFPGVSAELKAKAVAGLAATNDVRQVITVTAEGITGKSINPIWTREVTSKFGETFLNPTLDGKQVQVVVTLEGDKLVEKISGPYTSDNYRQIVGDKMIYKMTTAGVTSTRTYKRVSS